MVLDKITDERAKKWFENNWNLFLLERSVNSCEKRGYELLPNGLMIKPVFKNLEEERTLLQAVVHRPVDVHHHPDVIEAIYFLSGKGSIIAEGMQGTICEGDQVCIPEGHYHSFRPNVLDSLEILVICSGILDLEKEPWGNKVILKYKISEKGVRIMKEILDPYEELFPRENKNDK